MLKSTKTTKKPAAKPRKPKAVTQMPPENVKIAELLQQWRQAPPASDEEIAAYEEALKSLDESRPHRPLFTSLFS